MKEPIKISGNTSKYRHLAHSELTLLQEIEQMIKDAKAGKTVDMDAMPPPVAAKAPAPSPPVTTQAIPERENQGPTQTNKATNADHDTALASNLGVYST